MPNNNWCPNICILLKLNVEFICSNSTATLITTPGFLGQESQLADSSKKTWNRQRVCSKHLLCSTHFARCRIGQRSFALCACVHSQSMVECLFAYFNHHCHYHHIHASLPGSQVKHIHPFSLPFNSSINSRGTGS